MGLAKKSLLLIILFYKSYMIIKIYEISIIKMYAILP